MVQVLRYVASHCLLLPKLLLLEDRLEARFFEEEGEALIA